MKKLLCLLMMLSAILSACGRNDAPAKTKIVTTGNKNTESSAVSDGGQEVQQAEGDPLSRLAADLNDSAFTLSAAAPETEDEPYQRVRTDGDFGQRVAKILQDNPSRQVQPPKTEGRILTLTAENGDLLDSAVFHGLDDTDPDYPGQMVVEIDADGLAAAYAYEEKVFKQLDALFTERTEGVKTEFQGSASVIASKYDLAQIRDDKGYDTHEFLQFGNRILWRFTPHTDGYVKPSTVELLDVSTGKSVYSFGVSETVTRMEKYDGEAGFDYRIITPTGISYRSSADRTREKLWRLPGIVSLFSASEELSGTFDMQHGKLAYAADDGVYLADEGGGNAQPVLFHSALSEVMKPAAAAGYTYYFTDPRFLLGGKRLAVSIVSPQTGTRRLGFAVTNLDTMETSYFTGATAADSGSLRYMNDKVITAQDKGVVTLINAENGDRGALPLNGLEKSRFLTWDCRAFAVWEPKVTGTEAHSSVMYLSSNQNINDLSRRLMSSYGGEYQPVGMTEEYVVGLNEDSRGLLFVATRYQTSRRTQAAASEAENSGSSSAISSSDGSDSSSEDDREAALPPDITPDL